MRPAAPHATPIRERPLTRQGAARLQATASTPRGLLGSATTGSVALALVCADANATAKEDLELVRLGDLGRDDDTRRARRGGTPSL